MDDETRKEFFELAQDNLDTIRRIKANELILQLLLAVSPEPVRQNLLSLLRSGAELHEGGLTSDPVYLMALESVETICSTTPYTYN